MFVNSLTQPHYQLSLALLDSELHRERRCSPDKESGVLYVHGPNRIGLTATTANWLKEHGANIDASSAPQLLNVYSSQYRFVANKGRMRDISRNYPAALDS